MSKLSSTRQWCQFGFQVINFLGGSLGCSAQSFELAPKILNLLVSGYHLLLEFVPNMVNLGPKVNVQGSGFLKQSNQPSRSRHEIFFHSIFNLRV